MVVAFAGTATSVAANSTSADLAVGTYQFIGKGIISLIAKPSATGMSVSLKSNGVPIIDALPISNFGATGGLDQTINKIDEVLVNPGRLELKFINTTGGALTVDYMVKYQPTR